MLSTRYSFQILIKLEFSVQLFKKYSNIKFRENPSSGSRVVRADGQTRAKIILFLLRLCQKEKEQRDNKNMSLLTARKYAADVSTTSFLEHEAAQFRFHGANSASKNKPPVCYSVMCEMHP